MSDSPKVSLTFKAGPGYEAPWVVVHGNSVEEAGLLLQQVRQQGVFAAVKAAAAEFANSPAAAGVTEAQAIQTVQSAFPGSQVLPPQQQPQAQPQGQADPFGHQCPDCGGPTTYREGTSQRGPYKAYFCNNKPRGAKGHVIWL